MIEERRFKRAVEPFDDVFVDVDLQSVLTEGPGWSPAPYVDVYPLADWIEDGWVSLRVVAPHHFIPKEYFRLLEHPNLLRRTSGGSGHRSLCVLACVYLAAIGKKTIISGNSLCSYSGGWADVAAHDGSIYVECGTLNTRKPINAMLHGETLMVLPYLTGCDKLDEKTIVILDPFPEVAVDHEFELIGRVQLGYIFEPKCRLKPDLFAPPIGLRASREKE